jgi:predicted PurR-regulated permease PerM
MAPGTGVEATAGKVGSPERRDAASDPATSATRAVGDGASPPGTGGNGGVPAVPAAGPSFAAAAAAVSNLQLCAGLVTAAIVITALHVGREIIVPLALAFLFGFVLSPLVLRLRRWGVPRAAAAGIVVVATLAAIVFAGMFLTSQIRTLSAELPTYRTNIQSKLRDLRKRIDAPGIFDGAMQTLDTVKREVERKPAGARSAEVAASPVQRVQVEPPPISPIHQAEVWLAAAAGPLATIGIVLVFVFLVLIDRQDLRDRLLRLLGGNLHRTTDAMDEAGERIARYLQMQLVVNACYGIPMAAGLWMIGVPGAVVWGAIAAVMRFMPYVGSMISAVAPIALAFAVDPGWSLILWTVGLIVGLEVLLVNIVEPWLYGASTGLSVMSLLVSASFWTALWGPIGLVMSTPLTVCLLVIGKYLPHLQFLDVLLGSQPALDAPTRFYQRLLADDVEEAVELANERVDADSVAAFYHQVGVPALRQASGDHESVSTAEHRHRVVTGMDRVIDELREQHPPAATPRGRLAVVCIGGKWEVDTLAARMLAHALALTGAAADHRAAGITSAEMLSHLDLHGARVVCLSHFSNEPQTQVRYLCRRLRRRWPDLHIVLALWNAPQSLLDEQAYRALGADSVATSIDEAVMRIGQQLGEELSDGYLPAPIPQADVERVRAMRASGVLGLHLRPLFEQAAKRAADVFDVQLAMVSMIDDEQQLICGASGPLAAAVRDPESTDGSHQSIPRSLSVCGHVVASAETLVVEDIARDPRFASNPVLSERGIRFYAGAPLRDAEGAVYGSLCLLDTAPRAFSEREARLLEGMAGDVMTSVLGEHAAGADGEEADTGAAGPDVEPPSATVGQLVPS